MGEVNSYFYFEDPTGLALRQKYVTFEAFVNQLYLQRSIGEAERNVLLFDKNVALGMLKIKYLNNNNRISTYINYVYSSSQIHTRNNRTLFGMKIEKTRKHFVKLIRYLDSPFVLSPGIHRSVFSPLKVNSQNEVNGLGAFSRKFDTEYKILEHFAKTVDRHSLRFPYYCVEVDIYTRLEPCASCTSIAEEFVQRYQNGSVNFYYDRPY